MSHANAPFNAPARLRLARLIVEDGWPVRRAADRYQCSPATASKWARRYQAGLTLTDRSSCPKRSPTRFSVRRERRIIALRFTRQWGPHRISYRLRIARSTVERVLNRYGMPKLSWVDRATGLPTRQPLPKRYERSIPGELVHVDIKKLGRIPDGGGHRVLHRSDGNRNTRNARTRNQRRGLGYAYLHPAVDDHSRLAYSEILADEKKATAAGFWVRANAYFESCGITVQAVMTDNGSCYRSLNFAQALGTVRHIWTRPYRPQTNGKVERFNRTLSEEWAYARPYRSEQERVNEYGRVCCTFR